MTATPAVHTKQRIFRAVSGAVKNTRDGHPEWKISRAMALSIAKRATGTLVSQWPALAAVPSESRCGNTIPLGAHVGPYVTRQRARGASLGADAVRAARPRRSPLRFLHDRLGFMAGEAKRAGKSERAEALIEVLRLIAEQQRSRA